MLKIIRADLGNQTHADSLVHLLSIYALDPMGGGKDLSAEVKENLAATLNKRSDVHVVLAYVADEAVGLVNCIEGFSTFLCKPLLNIHDAVVKAEYRGQGISRLMFHEVEEIARELGCCKLTLEVLEGNAAARLAYSNFGFHGYELEPEMGKAMFLEKKL